MKEMNLFLMGIILLFGLIAFTGAEVNNTNSSFENNTIINLSLEDNFASSNETNESVVLNETPLDENQTGQANESILLNGTNESVKDIVIENRDVAKDLVTDDIRIEDAIIERKISFFDVTVSYISDVVTKINAIHENLVLVILIILWVLSLSIYSVFYDTSSAKACFSKASSLHRKATIAHVNGNYAKAKKLYDKSYLLREKGEGEISGGYNDGAI